VTTTAPELGAIDSAFNAALQSDAGTGPAAPGPPVAPPPRKSDNPDAPHGYGPDGTTPLAPYGHKPDGRPRIKPGGPGRAARPSADDMPRVGMLPTSAPASSSSAASGSHAAADGPDYAGQLNDLGTTIWLAGSMLRGGRLFIIPVPDARPYAAVLHDQLPGLVNAWNVAAKQDPTIRGYVEKLSGEGSWSWRVGVAVTTIGFVAACTEMAKAPPELKAAAAAANDAELERFMTAQIAELGLEMGAEPGLLPSQTAAAA
jgi:hypothetical protein